MSTREVISLPADKVVEYSRSDWEEKVRNATLSWSASQHLIHLRFVEIALFRGHPDLPGLAEAVSGKPTLLSLEDGERIFSPNGIGLDVLNVPKVVARPGVEAKVEVVREFIYPINYDPETEPLIPTDFATENTGVTAKVTTWATSNPREVRLDFVGRVSEHEGFRRSTKFPGTQEPVFIVREARYKGRLENGSYVVLGKR